MTEYLEPSLTNKLKYQKFSYEDEEYVIHMLTSAERTFFTNAYIVETKNALVVVDTLMINSDALQLRQYINDIAKPLIAVIITHGHPDHYNGTPVVVSGFNEIPIISTRGVKDNIRITADSKEIKWKPYFGQDWPETKLLPTQLVINEETLNLDGLDYYFKDLGAAESNSDLYFTIGNKRSAVFVGDVVFNKMHGFMNDGHTGKWLLVLSRLLAEISDVKQLFTGHGVPGTSLKLIEAQIDYIVSYRTNLLELTNGIELINELQKESFVKLVISNYPEYQLTTFIKAGIEGVSQELLLENRRV